MRGVAVDPDVRGQLVVVAVPAGGDSDLTATSMRGPGTRPAAIASRSATSAKSRLPRSRTVVKPASSVLRAFATPSIAARAAVSRQVLVGRQLLAADQVHVGVDEPGQQGHVAEVDVDRLARLARLDRGDGAVLDPDDLVAQQAPGLDVEQPRRRNGERLRSGERRTRKPNEREKNEPHRRCPDSL